MARRVSHGRPPATLREPAAAAAAAAAATAAAATATALVMHAKLLLLLVFVTVLRVFLGLARGGGDGFMKSNSLAARGWACFLSYTAWCLLATLLLLPIANDAQALLPQCL